MVSPETVRLLRLHAGLEGTAPESLAGAAFSGEGVSEAVTTFVAVLERLNHELNGPRPSESFVGASDVQREVAYSVSEVTGALRDAGQHIEDEHRPAA